MKKITTIFCLFVTLILYSNVVLAAATNFLSFGELSIGGGEEFGITTVRAEQGTTFSHRAEFSLAEGATVIGRIFDITNLPDVDTASLSIFNINGASSKAYYESTDLPTTDKFFSLGYLAGEQNYFFNIEGNVGGTAGASYGIYLSAVPIPATAWLLITGLAGLIGVDRFNKKKVV